MGSNLSTSNGTPVGASRESDGSSHPPVKVAIENVSHYYGDPGDRTSVNALKNINLEISAGEFVAIVGPSGCGKSTLLRLVAGLQDVVEGKVQVNTTDPNRAKTAMVFQDHALLPWRTVLRNVTFGLENRGVAKAEAQAVAAHELARLGLSEFGAAYPHQLSGGMKQRVGIARALAANAEILLMDEPLGALDAQTRTVLQDQILELRQAQPNLTCMYVTHAIDEAIFLADRIVLMTARPGQVKAEISVELGGPRDASVRGTAEFAKLSAEIWEHLRDEVQRASAEESAKLR